MKRLSCRIVFLLWVGVLYASAQDNAPSPIPIPPPGTRAGQQATPALSPTPNTDATNAPAVQPPATLTEQAPLTPPMQPGQTLSAQPPLVQRSSATDAARYLAGMLVSEGSPLASLTSDPRWQSHARAMNSGFAQIEQRQLSNIRIWRSELLDPVTQESHTCLYFFSGPDFLYADAFFPNCTQYILVGLEPVESMPELQSLPQPVLLNTLQNIQASLNTILAFSFFKTKDMRQDLGRTQLKGVLPIIFVFLARTGKTILDVEYVSLDRDGKLGTQGGSRGVKITFADPASASRKTLYYFSADLSDDGLRKNPGILRFSESVAPTNSFLKAASYLLHESGFNTVRNFLLQVSATILQDDSGLPLRSFTPDRWVVRFFGSYSGPINLFKNFYQPDLRQLYSTSSPRPLTFGFGYQWNRHNSTLMLAARK
jgi:hypothetical protein